MKLRVLSFVLACVFMAGIASAQQKTSEISVSGNCGMCKATIEKAAKAGGAATANWSTSEKTLSVSFDSTKTSLTKIQQAVAGAGYDTQDFRGSDAAYEKLHACCKYERTKTYPAATSKQKGGDAKDCCKKENKKCAE
ncbi:MAG: cation transporter [Niabella sp.]